MMGAGLTVGRALYLGAKGQMRPPGKHVKERFERKTFVVEEWNDAAHPMRFDLTETSLWNAIKMYYQNARRVVHDSEGGKMAVPSPPSRAPEMVSYSAPHYFAVNG